MYESVEHFKEDGGGDILYEMRYARVVRGTVSLEVTTSLDSQPDLTIFIEDEFSFGMGNLTIDLNTMECTRATSIGTKAPQIVRDLLKVIYEIPEPIAVDQLEPHLIRLAEAFLAIEHD